MGAGRSRPVAMQQSNRAYQTFYEMFRNTHSYLTENEVEPNAVMTWAAMSQAQKSQFQHLEVPARAHMDIETLPNSDEECYKPVSAKKEKTKVKCRPKRKPKPKVKATSARTKTLKATKKSNKVLNSTTKVKLKKRKTRTNKRDAANNTNTTRK